MRASRLVSPVVTAAAAFSLLVGALALVAPPASADGEVTVVWPEITAFNPDTTDYVVEVSYGGDPQVFLVVFDAERNQEFLIESEGPGPHTIPFSILTGDGTRFVEVIVCDATCETVSTSPELTIRRALPVSTNGGGYFGPNKPVTYSVGGGAQNVDLEWELKEGSEVLASGQIDDAPANGALPPLDHGLTEETDYTFRIHVQADVEPFGPLAGFRTFSFKWDRVNQSRVIVAETVRDYVPLGEIYPVADGFLDRAVIRAEAPSYDDAGVGFVDIEIRNQEGEVVYASDSRKTSRYVWTWDGRDETGQVLPEGAYVLDVTAKDSAWNVMTFSRTLEISHEEVVRRVWRQSFQPDEAMFQQYASACGWFKRPARAEWTGSVGFYTRNKCADLGQRVAGTLNRVDAPESVTGNYGRSRVTVVGGKSSAERRSSLRMTYMYRDNSGELIGSVENNFLLPGNVGRHPGAWGEGYVITDESGDRALYWGIRATDGSRYDVRRYVVELEYDVLQAGGSS